MGAKYLSDGRKVVVVGKLNAQETIVQEIFVTKSGQEIPSGENFVVKSLHDEPVISWKQRETEAWDKRYEGARCEFELKMRRLRAEESGVRLKIEAVQEAAKFACAEQLDMLKMFLAGDITHLLISPSYSPRIVAFDSLLLEPDEYSRYEYLKLLTLFGNSKGSLSWRLNDYRDGSGSWTEIYPARSYADALRIAQEQLDRRVTQWREHNSRRPESLYFTEWAKVPTVLPADVQEHNAKVTKLQRDQRITELEAELAKVRQPIAEPEGEGKP